ncbi:MAG: RimK family alpha-L-glutamate ligase [Candidatus Scalindua sp.]|nr:RimK family alpha-L-glutamate ligase [Candidatus Scalindua sp.]
MAKIGIYVERNTITNGLQMNGLMKFSHIAQKKGHTTDFLFRPDMFRIPEYDAIYIRAFTDPLNSSYIASRTAEMHGVRVIDDSVSIRVCCDKINMYRHLIRAGVPIPETIFLNEQDLSHETAERVVSQLGKPVVLKAPNSSFSLYVEKVETAQEFVRVGKGFLRRADRIVAQRFIKSEFDWRVGIIGGQPLYVCQYSIPKKRWKIASYTPDGNSVVGTVCALSLEQADPRLLECAQKAGNAIGKSLYGVDLKQVGDDYLVIEVNDNPTINSGDEDKKAPDLYERLINFLIAGK